MTLPFELSGTTLVVGATNTGKTRLTARALDAWIDDHGPTGVVVLDFAPEFVRDGALIGGRMTRFVDPVDTYYAAIDAHAPRASTDTESEALALAAENAAAVAALLSSAPADPHAVFVNDATIACGHPDADIDELIEYCNGATCVVMNAYRGDELGDATHAVTRSESACLRRLLAWADHVVELG